MRFAPTWYHTFIFEPASAKKSQNKAHSVPPVELTCFRRAFINTTAQHSALSHAQSSEARTRSGRDKATSRSESWWEPASRAASVCCSLRFQNQRSNRNLPGRKEHRSSINTVVYSRTTTSSWWWCAKYILPSFIRAKRVSNWYIPKKKSARVHACTRARVFDFSWS